MASAAMPRGKGRDEDHDRQAVGFRQSLRLMLMAGRHGDAADDRFDINILMECCIAS
ncbi:MAG: hypothetical protein U1E17_07905 [Geminicoccaceae bacterium]